MPIKEQNNINIHIIRLCIISVNSFEKNVLAYLRILLTPKMDILPVSYRRK